MLRYKKISDYYNALYLKSKHRFKLFHSIIQFFKVRDYNSKYVLYINKVTNITILKINNINDQQ